MIGKRDKFWGGFEKQTALKLRWRRVADCSRGGIRQPEVHDHQQWTAAYVGSLAAKMTTTGDGDSWKQRRSGYSRKDTMAPGRAGIGRSTANLKSMRSGDRSQCRSRSIIIWQTSSDRRSQNISGDGRPENTFWDVCVWKIVRKLKRTMNERNHSATNPVSSEFVKLFSCYVVLSNRKLVGVAAGISSGWTGHEISTTVICISWIQSPNCILYIRLKRVSSDECE